MSTTTPLDHIIRKGMRSEILAAGCAILFGYFLNFVAVSILELIGKLPRANRIKLYVSRIMYFFGVGGKKRGYLGMASTCSLPGLHGVFHAIMAWITFVALLALHIVYAIDFNDVKGVKRGAAMGFYWVCLTTWWWGLMIYFLKDTRGL